ncbi:uncharacterized protein LOC122975451 [Thunnus albacares]|uniref:uncharacterized protein LOC122975451 n=1 Tax=Thunnus albacares TaxID=8236 RepID=UPI001CF6A8CE|nr:uncharacterized protein LOC122975451 [Thunnus albacares]
MCRLFYIAYTVAYCEQAFSLFKILVSVERKHGLELRMTCHNSKACRIVIELIAATMRDNLHALVKCEPFYCSLIFDGSTNKGTSEEEVVSVKLIEHGTPRIRLLSIAEPDSFDTEGIVRVITEKCKENHLKLSNCLTATDANSKKTNIVLAQLQQQSASWMIKVHCVTLRLELCLKDAFKDLYFTQVRLHNQQYMGIFLCSKVLLPIHVLLICYCLYQGYHG